MKRLVHVFRGLGLLVFLSETAAVAHRHVTSMVVLHSAGIELDTTDAVAKGQRLVRAKNMPAYHGETKCNGAGSDLFQELKSV